MGDEVTDNGRSGAGTLLSAKQREVLDLLLQHKTSKEIARDLGISPHTVEQRLRIARERLGVSRRSDLVAKYLHHNSLYGQTVYEVSPIASSAFSLSHEGEPRGDAYLVVDHQVEAGGQEQDQAVLLVPAIFLGPTGYLLRVGSVFAIAAAAIMVAIGGLAMFQELSRILQ